MTSLTNVLAAALTLLGWLALLGPAAAHPHVWIDSRTDVIFDDHGMIVAIGHEWTMDEMYTSMAIEGLDSDKDGNYSETELAPLTKENIESLKDFGYFTHLKANGKDVAFNPPVEAGQLVSGKRARLHFELPLAAPLDPRRSEVVLKVYDPEFFIDIEFSDAKAVNALGGIAPGCEVRLEEPKSDQQTNDTRSMLATKGVDWQPDPEDDFGSMFAQPIAVHCAGALAAASPTTSVAAEVMASAPAGKDMARRALVPQLDRQGAVVVPGFWSDPAANIMARQRQFYQEISGALQKIKAGSSLHAALTLMLLSFGYGVFHAAGPGHGKTVISGWLLATEQQLRRGILIAFASSIVQALSAILIVTAVLLLAQAAGTAARSIASLAEKVSYGLIALLGLFLLWQGVRQVAAGRHAPAPLRDHEHRRDHGHVHDEHCGHAHLPTARALGRDWSLGRALSLSLAVGVRPCTGAILALLFANAIGLYWAGVTATFVMSLGTAITVSAIAALAVLSRSAALRFFGGRDDRLVRLAAGLKLLAGLAITFLGITLLVGSFSGMGGSV